VVIDVSVCEGIRQFRRVMAERGTANQMLGQRRSCDDRMTPASENFYVNDVVRNVTEREYLGPYVEWCQRQMANVRLFAALAVGSDGREQQEAAACLGSGGSIASLLAPLRVHIAPSCLRYLASRLPRVGARQVLREMSKRNFNDDGDGDASNRKPPARPDFCTGDTMNDSREEGAAPSEENAAAAAAGRSQAGDDERTGRAAAAAAASAAEQSDGGSADPTARSSSHWERRTFAAGSSAAHDGGDDDGIRASLDASSLLGPFSGGPLAAVGPWMRNDMPTEPTTGAAAAAAPFAGRLHERYGVEDTRQDGFGFFGEARVPPIPHRRPRKVRMTRGEMDLPTGIQRGLSPEEVQARLASYPEEVRRQDEAGRLPVHVAAAQRNPSTDVVRLLVTAYPDALQVHDNDGRTPLYVAAESVVRVEGDQGRPRESSMETIEFLATADPSAIHVPDNLGRTPWDVALEGHRPAVVQLFAISPGTLRARDGDGRLPLHAAVARGRIDMVQVLAPLAPDALQAADSLRRLPLHVAAAAASATAPGPWAELVRYLLAHNVGAVRARDAGGRTPLFVAAESGASLDVLYELLRTLHDVLVPSR
jgi:hypothetical protein